MSNERLENLQNKESKDDTIIRKTKLFFSSAWDSLSISLHKGNNDTYNPIKGNNIISNQFEGLDSRLKIENIHTKEFDERDSLLKELWLGRELYSFLLPLTSHALSDCNLEKAEDCVSEWENCLKYHSEIFPLLYSVFSSILKTFQSQKYLSFLKIWIFFLEQQGLIEIKKVIIDVIDTERDFFRNNHLIDTIEIEKIYIKQNPWILQNESKQLVVLLGELEVKNDPYI